MNRMALASVFLFIASVAFGATLTDPTIWRSSYTATADTTKNIALPRNGAKFHGVVVSSVGAQGSAVIIYDSSATATNPVASIDTRTLGSYYYDIRLSSGITYTKTGTANVTILYAPLF